MTISSLSTTSAGDGRLASFMSVLVAVSCCSHSLVEVEIFSLLLLLLLKEDIVVGSLVSVRSWFGFERVFFFLLLATVVILRFVMTLVRILIL